jgi:putative PEP-CTERM system TPR-repeat lipoprotein
LAETFVQQDRRDLAISSLLAALRVDPGNAGVRWRLSELYLDVGDADAAVSHLLAAVEAGASPSASLPLIARARLLGDDLDALFAMELPSSLSPDARAAVLALKARGRVELRQLDQAQTLLRDAAAAAPHSEAVGVARAWLLVAQGRREQAHSKLRQLLEDHPDSPEALGMLADLVRDAGELAQAEYLYTRALAHSASKLHLHFLRAEVRLDLGDLAGAGEDTAVLESAAPDSFAALYPRARLLLAAGQFEQALAVFEAASKLQPSHPGTLLHGGAAAYALGRANLAEDWLLRVFKGHPDNPRARLILGAMRFGQGRYGEAEDLLRPFGDSAGSNPVPKRLLAAALVAQDKAAEAVPLLSELVASRPDNPRAQLDLSVALVLSGAKQRGVAALDGLVARHPDYRPAYEYLIAFYVRERQWTEAGRWAEQFVARYPDDPGARFFQGEVLLEAGRSAEARDAYTQALEIDAAYPDANMRLADLALAAGDTERAAGHFSRILAEDPQNLDGLMGQGRLAAAAGRFDESRARLETAVAAHPHALRPRMALARQLYDRGNPQSAAGVLREGASAAFRRDAPYLRLLAESLLAAGTPQQAADAARELVVLLPDSLQAYGLYARILTVLDDKVALEETLKQMLTIDPAHVPTRLELVRLHIATGRFEVAERLLSPLLADLARPPLADFLYGLILMATDRPGQAVAPLSHAHDRMQSQRTVLALANAEAQAGRLEKAVERQTRWLAEHPQDVEVRVNLAGHLVQAEQVSEALGQYEQALAIKPGHIVALNNLAWYSLETDPQRAIELAGRALEARPESLETAHTLASAQVRAEAWRDAQLTLDRALARYPTDSALLWLSALVLHHKGQAEPALRRLERLLEADLPADERQRATALLGEIEDELRAEQAKVAW